MEIKYSNNSDKVISYWRVLNDQKVIVIVNLDTNTHYIDIEFPNAGEWTNILDNEEINIESNWYGGFELEPLTSYIFVPSVDSQCILGDINQDSIINVIDIVSMVNYILLGTGLEANQICAADLNSDNIINVIDIVSIVNIILNQ